MGVKFTDDAGNAETLTSAATREVASEAGPLTGFTVVDASSRPQTVLGKLEDGAVLTLSDPVGGSYGIRADTGSGDNIDTVRLELSGEKTAKSTERILPYSLYGDDGLDALHGEPLPAGYYDLEATAYSDDGDKLGSLAVSFTVLANPLHAPVKPPEQMAFIWWHWEIRLDSSGEPSDNFEELIIDFTIHNDVDLKETNGLYLMLAYSNISNVRFYLGLQTDVKAQEWPRRRGKGLIFSRWETLDLGNARYSHTDGWTESSSHEGDFIGVRRSYEWGAGDYRVRIAPDGAPEEDGVWFGLWITDLGTDVTTWIGSLRFPLLNGKAVISESVYSTMEIYGRSIRPIDIPEWHVSLTTPQIDGTKPGWGETGYSIFATGITNSEVQYDPDNGVVHLKAGGNTERQTPEGYVSFK